MKKWKRFEGDNCPKCNSNLIVHSENQDKDTEFEQYFYDGDTVKCSKCSFRTKIVVVCSEAGLKYYDEH
jgi:uncharacterized protein with PIN domain